MDLELKEKFLGLWERFFPGAELPLAFFYADDPGDAEPSPVTEEFRCLAGALNPVRAGRSRCFDGDRIGCFGGKRYAGFAHEIMPGFEYFLSYGIPGRLEGERYKKSPELVLELLKTAPAFSAPARWLIFKRWDRLNANDSPEAAVFFAPPDVLAGLFSLANFDEAGSGGVYTPFGAGCGGFLLYPLLENRAERPRCVLGLFDPSARACLPGDVLSFAAPWRKFVTMVGNMEDSFLITRSWDVIRKRIQREGKK